MSAHQTWFGPVDHQVSQQIRPRSGARGGARSCAAAGRSAASPIFAISRRTRLRPTTWPWRRRWRAIWRLPYHGVSRNCASISRIRARFSALSPFRRSVPGRPADPDQRTLPAHRQRGVLRLDHLAPPGDAHRPEAFAKKSRSTTSCPILACSFSSSPSRSAAAASALPENTPAMPSIACRFQALISV